MEVSGCGIFSYHPNIGLKGLRKKKK